jgi:transcriptional regulator GlxA family with amidase domain
MMRPMPTARASRDIVVVAFSAFQILDVTGPTEVFSQAARLVATPSGAPAYRIAVVAKKAGRVRSSSGVELVVEGFSAPPKRCDTLVVAGGQGTRSAVDDTRLVAWIDAAAGRARRVASVCTGAFLLARAGRLKGRRATTHWESCERLAKGFPDVTVEPDRIFVKDGNVYTSAGVTAGIDLALALVAEDHGRPLALRVARELVVFLQRPGGQSQFSAQLATQVGDREPLSDVRAWIEEHLAGDLSVPALARRAGMSPRNFARRFGEEVGETPARYVQAARLDAARRRLEESRHGLEKIAVDCGLGSADAMRRAFVAALSTTPSSYRARFWTKGRQS